MSRASHPPTPDSVPLLGHGLAFSRHPFDAMEEWATEGDVVQLSFPGRSLYMVTGPDLIEHVLVQNQGSFTIGRQQRQAFSGVEDDAVTANTGGRWRRLRRALHPAFTWDGIQEYGPRMAERTTEQVSSWETGETFDLLREMRLLTLRILGDTLLGVDIEGNENLVLDAADALVERADPRRFGQLLPEWVPTPTQRRFELRISALNDYVADVLEHRSPGEGDVCSVLLAARERGDLSTAEVRDNLTALLLAGHDSVAVSLTYAWYELSRHPDVRETLFEEAETVVENDLPGTSDFEALERTRHVVKEILRLYPPTWAVNREAAEQTILGGYEIPAGAQLMMPQWVVHRDHKFWEAPDTFDPSRWRRDADRPEYAYFPFSGGPRHCIGLRFARLELVMALTTMVSRATLDVSVDAPLTFTPSLSLRPEPNIEATVRPR